MAVVGGMRPRGDVDGGECLNTEIRKRRGHGGFFLDKERLIEQDALF